MDINNKNNSKDLLDLIRSEPDSDSHIYLCDDGRYVTNEWLCGSFAGRAFNGNTPEEAVEKLSEYLTQHIDHDSMVGRIVTKSGWPNLKLVKTYLNSLKIKE